jgi:hypothetical protein
MLFNFFMILLLYTDRATFVGRGSVAPVPATGEAFSHAGPITVIDVFSLPDLVNRYEQAIIPRCVMLIYINAI